MTIVFTKHALNKFGLLKKHGFPIAKKLVLKAVIQPESIDRSRLPLLIGQIKIDRNHVLRVVYKEENSNIKIITFYPGRKKQYEKK